MQAATKLGETIYKGHRSYDLMLNLQLGIRHSVQAYAKQPPVKGLTAEHFTHKVCSESPADICMFQGRLLLLRCDVAESR